MEGKKKYVFGYITILGNNMKVKIKNKIEIKLK